MLAALIATTLTAQSRPVTTAVTETNTQNGGNPKVTVYVTAKGKTYHTYRDCMSLDKAKTVLTASEADAEQHGLTICGICAHRHHTGAGKDNSSWATAESEFDRVAAAGAAAQKGGKQ